MKRRVSRYGNKGNYRSGWMKEDRTVPKELTDLTVDLLAETELAWRVDDGTKQEWVAKSLCEMEQNPDGTYTLTIPVWLATQKGFA